jgi:hypothetical protein
MSILLNIIQLRNLICQVIFVRYLGFSRHYSKAHCKGLASLGCNYPGVTVVISCASKSKAVVRIHHLVLLGKGEVLVIHAARPRITLEIFRKVAEERG